MAPEKEKVELKNLIENYQKNQALYKKISGSTEALKKDYILPFFKILGWDIANKSSLSLAKKDLLLEDSIIIPGKPKPPDFSFRLDGARKFFVEVRNPSFPIFDHEEGSLQLRRYGYTSNICLSILTDLEEFVVYDTRMKPDKNDLPHVGRVFYCTVKDYFKPSIVDPAITNVEWIISIFSKSAVMNGSIEKFVETLSSENYSSNAELEFLKRIDEWRFMLAREIAILNQDLSIEQINYAVQKMLDRFIILRIAEDLNMEKYAILYQASMVSGAYGRLLEIFHKVDEKINSRIFRSDQWLEEIQIGDCVLFSIIQQLYYPECPFEFSVFATKTLEDIFEQFLSKTIQFSKKKEHATKIPEITKVSPGFTTPSSIVDYMVEKTLGRVLEGVDKNSLQDIQILDPYCRTGKFLVCAFDYFLKFYEHHCRDDEKIWIPERQNILLRHIFGIDPDPHALEITKMSIFLKVIENLSKKEIEPIIKNPHLRIMPDFHNNLFQTEIQNKFDVLVFSPPAFSEFSEKPINLDVLFHQSLSMLKPNGWLACLIDSSTFFRRRGDTFLHYLAKKTSIHEILIIEQDLKGKYPFSVLMVIQNTQTPDITKIQLGLSGPRKHVQQYELSLEMLKEYHHLFV